MVCRTVVEHEIGSSKRFPSRPAVGLEVYLSMERVSIGAACPKWVTCRLKLTSSLLQLLLRVVGCLSHKNGAASSGGRRPTSLSGGNRGPITRGGATFYGESGIDPLGWIGRLGSTPLRRSARDGFRAKMTGLSQPSRRWMGARGGKRMEQLGERRCVWSRTSGG